MAQVEAAAGTEAPRETVAPQSLLARARPLMIARAGAAGLSFAIPLALARAFPQDEYGTYKLLFLIAQTLYHVLPFGMGQSLYYFMPRAAVRRAYLVQTLGFLSAAGALAAVGIVALAPWLAGTFNSPGLPEHARMLGIYTFAIIGSIPLEIALTARGQTGRAAVIYVVSDAAKAVVMVAPALLGAGLHGVMVGLAAFAVVRLLATWALLLRSEDGASLDRGALRAQLAYALPFGAAMMLSVPQQFFHQFVVSTRLDAASFAVYAVGIFQLPVIDLLYTPTSEVLMVRIAELEREGRPEAVAAVFREAVARLALFFLPLSGFLFVAAPEFIEALFTARYLGAVPIFQVVALGILLACLPVDGVLRARDETRHIFGSYAVKAAITVPLVLVGVARLGMMGGVGAWLAAELVGKVVLAARVPRALGVPRDELLPWAELGRLAAASLLALGGVFAARALLPSGWAPLRLATVGVGYGIGYLAALVALGAQLPFFRRRAASRAVSAHG